MTDTTKSPVSDPPQPYPPTPPHIQIVPSSLPSREEVERAGKALIACARAVGIAIGSGTHADVDERREAAALASLLSLIPYRSER